MISVLHHLPDAPRFAQKVETAEMRELNAARWVAVNAAGDDHYDREVLVPDDEGDGWRRCRVREHTLQGEGRYGDPRWSRADIADDGSARVRCEGRWQAWRPPRAQGRSPRPTTSTRTRGGRRRVARSPRASRDGPSDADGEPPGLDPFLAARRP